MPKVSIIVAAYNIEKYIERSLKSIIHQTLNDIEIIIVNDGSTDNTLNVIENICKKDSRVKIINKKNAGLIEARKTGFKNATGEYVLFVDGDDWIELNTIETLYNNSISDNIDILCYGFKYAYDSGKIVKEQSFYKEKIFHGDMLLKELLLGRVYTSIWSKFIKRTFITENEFEFPSNISYGEDLATTLGLAINMPRTKIIKDELYYYYIRNESITNQKLNKSVFEVERAISYIEKGLINKCKMEKFLKEFEYFKYKNLYYDKVIIRNEFNSIHKELGSIWKRKKIKIYKNKFYKEFIKTKGLTTRIKCNLYNINYDLGMRFCKVYIKANNKFRIKKL